MGLFEKVFGKSTPKKEKVLPWIPLKTIDQLAEIEKKSANKTQVIFKHSTRCGISKMVLNQFVAGFDLDMAVDLYYLDLLSYREISNEVGYRFQVMHQSPQMLILKNGTVIAHASHSAINELDLSLY